MATKNNTNAGKPSSAASKRARGKVPRRRSARPANGTLERPRKPSRAARVAGAVKGHPVAATAAGVGLGLLAVKAVRSVKATRRDRENDRQAGERPPIRDVASAGHDRGRTGLEAWHEHPLALAAAAVAAGLALGLFLPGTRREDAWLGVIADRYTGDAKRAVRELLDQGSDLFGRVISEGARALTESTSQAGLTPERLGGKLRRVATDVRDAVVDAVKA